jgi:MoxR-like ATPase
MTLSRDDISDRLAAVGYIADRDIATALWLMDYLKRPLLLEGEAGVGKPRSRRRSPRCTAPS